MKRQCKETGEVYFALNEVFYKEDGSLWVYSERDDVVGDSPKEIIHALEMMLIDAKKDAPILTEKDFEKENNITWKSLTDYEIDSIAHKNFTWEFSSKELEQFARAIEKALKEKNNEGDA